MTKKKYVNTKDVVRMTGLTTKEVYALIHDGKLKAHKAPKSGWRIEEERYFDSAHNAMADVKALVDCFWEMRDRSISDI